MVLAQAGALRDTLSGDWVWLEKPFLEISGLLGARVPACCFLMPASGFDVSAFAALSGTLRAGSLLVPLALLAVWAGTPDSDSLRWSDSAEPILPRRISFAIFVRRLPHDPDAIVWQQTSR